jgi:hypothetical protein
MLKTLTVKPHFRCVTDAAEQAALSSIHVVFKIYAILFKNKYYSTTASPSSSASLSWR